MIGPLRTGYYANQRGRMSAVHISGGDGKPVCNSRIGPTMEFQWCANHVVWEYLDCEKCKNAYREHLIQEVNRVR